MARKRKNPDLVPVCSLKVGDKYYVNIIGDDYDEFEILSIDPVGNMIYRNNSFQPQRKLFAEYDSALMERLVFKRRPPIQIVLFPEPAKAQTDLFM